MAATEPTKAEPAAAQDAMLFDGLQRVAGATGVEATVTGHQRTDGIAVELDRKDDQFTHADCVPLLDRRGEAGRIGFAQDASTT